MNAIKYYKSTSSFFIMFNNALQAFIQFQLERYNFFKEIFLLII
jgi:hypothetical protein